jgi:hypothetical protein
MSKFKLWKTVDCVVAGFYRKSGSQAVEHLLLALYDSPSNMVAAPWFPNAVAAMRFRRSAFACLDPQGNPWVSLQGAERHALEAEPERRAVRKK